MISQWPTINTPPPIYATDIQPKDFIPHGPQRQFWFPVKLSSPGKRGYHTKIPSYVCNYIN